MSRCLPFPPPAYVRQGASGDSLIDSIKLQKEKARADRKRKSKTEKNDSKTEKKESDKNGGKKEKRREKHSDRPDSKKRKISDIYPEVKENNLQEKPEAVSEQLENSGVTEEHEQLNSTNLCYSSDGTQSGETWKKDSLPSTSNQSNGSIICLRKATGNKQKEAETPLITGQQFAKSVKANPSYITQLPVQKQYASTSTPTIITTKEVTRHPDPNSLPSTSGKNHSMPADSLLNTSLKFIPVDKKLLKEGNLYNALTENWLPIPLTYDRVDADEDAQDWLFKSISSDNHSAKRFKACNDSPFQDSCSYGPRTCYLPVVDIYALPYVLPF